MRRPVVSMVLAAGILVMAAVPYFSINQGFSGISTLPDGGLEAGVPLSAASRCGGGVGQVQT